MYRLVTALVATALIGSASTASAQTASPLKGVWRQDNGEITVRVAPCTGRSNETLCATVIEQINQPGEPSLLNQTLVREMRPNGRSNWAGSYVVDGQSMKAKATLANPNNLSFKVCALPFLCDTIRFRRVGN